MDRRRSHDEPSPSMGALSGLPHSFFAALRVLSRGTACFLHSLLPSFVVLLAPLNGAVPRGPSALPSFVLRTGCIVPQHAPQFCARLRGKQQRQACPDERARDKGGPSHGIVFVILVITVPHSS